MKKFIISMTSSFALSVASSQAALFVNVTGDADGSGSTWVFNGTTLMRTTTNLEDNDREGLVNVFYHNNSELDGELYTDTQYKNYFSPDYAYSGSASGSETGAFTFSRLYFDSDNADAGAGGDDFGWIIGNQPSNTFFTGETLTFTNYTLTTDLDITTFGDGATAISDNGDTFTVRSTSELMGDLTMTFTAAAAPVPEPSSFALLGLGALALTIRRRK